MSTGCNCLFIEVAEKEWYYILEDTYAPKNSWDWREHANAYGPFTSEGRARDHLFNNHANPGGSMTESYTEGYTPDELETQMFAEARKRKHRSASEAFGPYKRMW